jgi:16S rRNA (cytosine967-C5)-methyltransferase
MTPAARYAAAIEILDKILAGVAAEKVLTNWARSNRFAGSGDRYALRDIVFDVLRCKRSFASLGGAETGRGLVLGALRAAGLPPESVFSGAGYAPAPLSAEEQAAGRAPSDFAALDCPDWLAPELQRSLGVDFAPIMHCLQSRAPVFLRVNLRKATLESAVQSLAAEGIATRPSGLAKTALEVTENPRKVQNSAAFQSGLVELQDAASQAVVEMLPLGAGARVLDYCAGGGGKSLAMAGQCNARYFAHDIAPERMKDLPVRAKRAGVSIDLVATAALRKAAAFDLVFADAPCSGSGSWRRAPESKWALTQERLTELCSIQSDVLAKASALVSKSGFLCYATCSLLQVENEDRINAFIAQNTDWTLIRQGVFTPLEGGDGFYFATLKRLS